MRTLTTPPIIYCFTCLLTFLCQQHTCPCRTSYDRPYSPFGSILLCPSTGLAGGSMLGDPVLLRNRSRLGPRRLRPLLARRRSCAPLDSKHANVYSNSKCRDHANRGFLHVHGKSGRLSRDVRSRT